MDTPIDWLLEAEEDLEVTRKLIAQGAPKHACWQAQQVAEKALKGLLKLNRKTIPKIHDLRDLLVQVRSVDPSFPDRGKAALVLTPYYNLVRYPDMRPRGAVMPTTADAQEALQMAAEIVADVRARIAPPAPPPPPTPPTPPAPPAPAAP